MTDVLNNSLESTSISMAKLVNAGLVRPETKRTKLIDEIKLMSSAVRRFLKERPESSRIIMVTSARPGEGKSYTALNLAVGLARYERQKVILVDFDSKPSSLTERLDLHQAPGLINLTIGKHLDPKPYVIPTAFDDMSFLPYGDLPDDTYEVRLPVEVIHDLHELYKEKEIIIIVDTPPCLSASEPATLSHVAGHTVFVVRAETTQRNEIEAATAIISGCRDIMFLLNGTHISGRDMFGSHPYYH
jgi:protein-tyrosine kinase